MTRKTEVLYDIPTILLIPMLLVILALVIFHGLRHGKHRAARTSETARTQVSALQSSLLGLLALLLGFSFSLALGRFDDRSVAVVSEANAIGTAWLRTDLLEGAARDDLRKALADYGQNRLAAGAIALTHEGRRDAAVQKASAAFATAWSVATMAARQTPNPATLAVVSALNDMTDSFSSRDAALNRHVPEPVLFLLFSTFLVLGWVLGYSSGVSQERPPSPVVAMVVLIVMLMSLILDLDRPRRGIISVDQTAMRTTVDQILTELASPPIAGN
ncbi:MAG: hypothetical protein ACOH2H_08245 [Cypionkella sp.]